MLLSEGRRGGDVDRGSFTAVLKRQSASGKKKGLGLENEQEENYINEVSRHPIRRGRVRARPASAQPSSRANQIFLKPATTAAAAAAAPGLINRDFYRPPRPTPPPWRDNIELDVGGGATTNTRITTRDSSTTKNRVAETACVRGSGDRLQFMPPSSIREKRSPILSTGTNISQHITTMPITERGHSDVKMNTGGGGARIGCRITRGRPYMSREERRVEDSKEAARLRREVEFWRDEAEAAKNEAASLRTTMEKQENRIEAVLRESAQGLPAYYCGQTFIDADVNQNPSSSKNAQASRTRVIEHRSELEKSLVVKRLRDHVSRLTDQLVAAEKELSGVKRSCQFTALTEMLTAGEEYLSEVTRLRAKLKEQNKPASSTSSGGRGRVNVPTVLTSPPKTIPPSTKPTNSAKPLTYGDEDNDIGNDASGGFDNHSAFESNTVVDSEAHMTPSEVPHEQPQTKASTPSRTARIAHQGTKPTASPQKKSEDFVKNRGFREGNKCVNARGESISRNSDKARGCWGGVRGKTRMFPSGSCAIRVSKQASAGISPVMPVDLKTRQRRNVVIDSPVRRGTTPTRSGGGPGSGITTEMEMDVMKGLVLAQQQRIERQRAKMQELEIHLREHRRATLAGGAPGRESRVEKTGGKHDRCTSERTKGGGSAERLGFEGTRQSPPRKHHRKGLSPCRSSRRSRAERSAPAGLDRMSVSQHINPKKPKTAVIPKTPADPERVSPIDPNRHISDVCDRSASRRHSADHSGAPCANFSEKQQKHSGRRKAHNRFGNIKDTPDFQGVRNFDNFGCFRKHAAANHRNFSAERGVLPTSARFQRENEGYRGTVNSRKAMEDYLSPTRKEISETSYGTNRGTVHGRTESDVPGSSEADDVGVEDRCQVDNNFSEKESSLPSLPEGWAKAMDNDTGHVYYFSETRSTWVRPTHPATPQETVPPSPTGTIDKNESLSEISPSSTGSNSSAQPSLSGKILGQHHPNDPALTSSEFLKSTDEPPGRSSEHIADPVGSIGTNPADLVVAAKALAKALSAAAGSTGKGSSERNKFVAEEGGGDPDAMIRSGPLKGGPGVVPEKSRPGRASFTGGGHDGLYADGTPKDPGTTIGAETQEEEANLDGKTGPDRMSGFSSGWPSGSTESRNERDQYNLTNAVDQRSRRNSSKCLHPFRVALSAEGAPRGTDGESRKALDEEMKSVETEKCPETSARDQGRSTVDEVDDVQTTKTLPSGSGSSQPAFNPGERAEGDGVQHCLSLHDVDPACTEDAAGSPPGIDSALAAFAAFAKAAATVVAPHLSVVTGDDDHRHDHFGQRPSLSLPSGTARTCDLSHKVVGEREPVLAYDVEEERIATDGYLADAGTDAELQHSVVLHEARSADQHGKASSPTILHNDAPTTPTYTGGVEECIDATTANTTTEVGKFDVRESEPTHAGGERDDEGNGTERECRERGHESGEREYNCWGEQEHQWGEGVQSWDKEEHGRGDGEHEAIAREQYTGEEELQWREEGIHCMDEGEQHRTEQERNTYRHHHHENTRSGSPSSDDHARLALGIEDMEAAAPVHANDDRKVVVDGRDPLPEDSQNGIILAQSPDDVDDGHAHEDRSLICGRRGEEYRWDDGAIGHDGSPAYDDDFDQE